MGHFDGRQLIQLSEPVGPHDHVRGPAAAEVTLVEYGDFACPSCRSAYGTIKELVARTPDLRFVFRANPRSHLFPQAEPAAEAAEIAAAQGKFWEMYDRLFEGDGDLSRPRLVALAAEIGLDAASFERALDDRSFRQAVATQEVSGWHSHVLATPTFFINGIRFDDSIDRLADAVGRAKRLLEPLHTVFREARVRSTEDPRRQIITVGPHEIVADLPVDEDGGDVGPGPHDLLLSALGACTAMTVQWAAAKY
ncbi:MAG TPA: thioredoxin domain-containing protein, partial [Polyangia bacterium]